jgi:uncharacterized protein YdiU (UPF0061 family)
LLSGETGDLDRAPSSIRIATTFSAIDELARYAYGSQPTIAQWNLAGFAETLLPLLDPSLSGRSSCERAISFTRFQEHWLAGMRVKRTLQQ